MPERPCCCTNEGAGHRCPEAWQLMILAQHARRRKSRELLDAARAAYTAHLQAAGLLSRSAGASAWPDLCTITMDDDPRCAQCATP